MAAFEYRRNPQRPAIAILLCMILLLSACSAETNLTLHPEERWVVTSTFSFDRRLLPELTVGLQVCRLIGLNIGLGTRGWGLAALESGLDELVAQYRGQGVEASWAKRGLPWGDIRYTVTVKGQGWDKLQLITPPAIELGLSESEGGEIHLSMRSTAMERGLGNLVPFTFRLRGGRILSSNADSVSGGTATWHRPTGLVEAVVTPAPERDLALPLLVGAAVLLMAAATGAGIFWYYRRRARSARRPPSQRPLRHSTRRRGSRKRS